MLYKDILKSEAFKAGDALCAIFESYAHELDSQVTESSVMDLVDAAKPVVVGPEVKNQATKDFEHIVGALISNKSDVVFSVTEGQYRVTLKGKTYDLSDIISNMQRNQVHLSAEQLDDYVKFIDSEASQKAQIPAVTTGAPILVSGDDLKARAPALKDLHNGELVALNIYTQNYFKYINQLLWGLKPFNESEPNFQQQMREVLLHTAVSLSGISKGENNPLPMTYRWDSAALPSPILDARIKAAESKGADLELAVETGFVSSAAEKPADSFYGPVRTVFYGLHGLDVSKISYYPTEREFLIPPSKMKYLTHTEIGGKHYFLATPIVPPISTKKLMELGEQCTFSNINSTINDLEKEMITKYIEFVKESAKVYLDSKQKRDAQRYTVVAVLDNYLGKGSKKLQYAQKMVDESEEYLAQLKAGTITPKDAYRDMSNLIRETTESSEVLDAFPAPPQLSSNQHGQLYKVLTQLSDKVDTEMHQLSEFKIDAENFLFNRTSFFSNPQNIDALRYVHEQYLSQAYEDTSDPNYPGEWTLDCGEGHLLNRPNHDLAHTMRGVANVTAVYHMYANYCVSEDLSKRVRDLTKDDLEKMQVAMIFRVCGRQSEIGFANDPAIYNRYLDRSADAFEDYVKKHYRHLFKTDDEIADWKKLVHDYAKPDNTDVRALIMKRSHNLDLLRCYTKDEFESKVAKVLESELGHSHAERLIEFSINQLRATGNRIIAVGEGYDTSKKWEAGNDVSKVWEQINQVEPPHIKDRQRYTADFAPLNPSRDRPSASAKP